MHIIVITACTNADGVPDFAWSEHDVSTEQYENSEHYDAAEQAALANGYEEPFVHFDENDLADKPWFITGIRSYLNIA